MRRSPAKDFKTGQTLMKTILAPGFKARMLGLSGWFSTNILGNRDGEVLEDPGSFKTKEESKLSVLDHILQPELYPELYGNIYHKVRINYYPPRGDNKEGWDNIDIFGWLGYPMQIKVDFLCRDSILAAPIVLDLVLFLDLAKRCEELSGLGRSGMAELLFQVADDGARALSGARSVHPVDEAEEHAAPPARRAAHHPPGAGVLRLSGERRPGALHQNYYEAALLGGESAFGLLVWIPCGRSPWMERFAARLLIRRPMNRPLKAGSLSRAEIRCCGGWKWRTRKSSMGKKYPPANGITAILIASAQGRKFRITAHQDASGEWRAKRVEILRTDHSTTETRLKAASLPNFTPFGVSLEVTNPGDLLHRIFYGRNLIS